MVCVVLSIACHLRASGAAAGPIVFVPQIDHRNRASEVTEFNITGSTPEALAEQARRASVRVGYGKPPLVFRTRFDEPAVLALHVARASVGGAKLLVKVGKRVHGLVWPPAAQTHIVGRTFFVVLPAGPVAATVSVPEGVVVIDRYTFFAAGDQIRDKEMIPMPPGENNDARLFGAESDAAVTAGILRERIPGFDPSQVVPGWPYTLSPHDTGLILEDCWPSIYFGVERLAEIRRKIDKLPWARAAFEQMKREAEAVLRTEPAQPVEQVGWRHDFYSRRSGEHLLYDPANPNRFLDPWTGAFEELPEQHRAWVLLTHERTHRLMRGLAFLYGLTGDERYAGWVAEGLRRAVEMFRHTELRNKEATDALYFQPLYDAPALIMLCDAYALTRSSRVYSAADHEAIRRGIFGEGIPYQIRFLDKSGIHNMSCFVAAALATAGYHFGCRDWVDRALRDERNSLAPLIKRGVPGEAGAEPDGFWFEGTMFYHYYSLCPLITLYELDKRLGGEAARDPDVQRRFEGLFAAPMALADSRLRLPTLGDLGAPKVMSLALYRHVYEYAAGQVAPKRFAPLLAAIYSLGLPRNSLTALAFGPDELPEPQFPAGHALLERRGIGVLRAPDDWYLLFKAGPHGAGHDHADKLHFSLNAFGQVLAPDPGTAGYALSDIHPYYRGTFSHNTLFVDGKNQSIVQKASLVWQPEANPPYAQGTVGDAYEGVILSRRLWFDPPYVVVADECVSEAEHCYGFLFHAYGSLTGSVTQRVADLGLPALEPLAPYLSGARRACSGGLLDATWRVAQGLYLRLLATSDGPFEALLGRTPGNPKPDELGVAVLRALGQERRFWSVFEAYRAAPTVSGVTASAQGVTVNLRDGSTRAYRPLR